MLQFSRRDVLQNTDFDPAAIENRRLVWTFSFEAAGSKAEGSISFHVILEDKSSTFIRIEREISVGWRRIVATLIFTLSVSLYRSCN